ncbi:MAG: hypothetical protein RL685_3909 [Pseudomonadota bacterium]
MRVRCRAIADPRGNALGTLELESTVEGLWLSYESVSSYRDGYAPSPSAQPSEHRVPWPSVRATRVGTEVLRLEVQEPLVPFTRFVLRDFALAEPQAWLPRARPKSRLDSVLLTQFCNELSLRLDSPVPHEVSVPGQLGLGGGANTRSLPRSGVALLIVAGSVVLAGVMLRQPQRLVPVASAPVAETTLHAPLSPPAPEAASVAPAASTRQEPRSPLEEADLPALPPPALGGGCECIRHESLLWQQPPPRLAAFVTQLERRPHGSHQHLDLQLTVVNDGVRELRGLNLAVQISTSHPDPSNPEEAPVERSQYFPEPLAPGQVLSWKASARGDRFRLRVPDLGRLDEDGIDAAPVAAFAELAAGPPGLVRIHGATMLAFLGDSGARDALLRVREGLSGAELAHVDRALESTASLRFCQLVVSPAGLATRAQSCLYNAADVAQSNFELQVRALRLERAARQSPFPTLQLLAVETLDWSGTLPPRRGRRLDLSIDLSRAGTSADRHIELVALTKRPE